MRRRQAGHDLLVEQCPSLRTRRWTSAGASRSSAALDLTLPSGRGHPNADVGAGGGACTTRRPGTQGRTSVQPEESQMATDRQTDEAFAFPDERKEPLVDAEHVRNAIARFNQVQDVTDADRDRAWKRILAAADVFWSASGSVHVRRPASEALQRGRFSIGLAGAVARRERALTPATLRRILDTSAGCPRTRFSRYPATACSGSSARVSDRARR